MRNTFKVSHLFGQRGARAVLALTLTSSVAAFGCTTNRTPGAGEPTRSGPGVRTAPTAGPSSGSEGEQLPPPMTSSVRTAPTLRGATPRAIHDMSIANGALTLPGNPVAGSRLLGAVNPAGVGIDSSAALVTGQYVNPTQFTNPQSTVNASISSNPTPVIASGAGGAVGAIGGVVAGVTSSGVIVDASALAPPTSGAAAVFPSVPSTVTLSSSGTPLTPGLSAANASSIALTPTVASSNIALADLARSSTLRTPTSRAPGVIVQSGTATSASSPVRLVTSQSGRVVVTNSPNQ